MFWLQRLNPANEFKEYFELAHAVSPALKDEVFRLRHRVFCDELGFEQAMFDGRERDEFDDQSRHLLLRSVKTGQCVGCVRLVMAHPDRPALPLPFEKLYAAVDGLGEQNPARLARASIAEISRLTLAREFRRKRRGDGKAEIAKDKPVGAAHPTYPYMHLGLYLGAIALAEQLGICKLFLLTEPRLLVHFRRLGLPVHQIAPPIEHRGLRVLSTADVVDPNNQLPFFMRPVYKIIALELGVERRGPARRRTGAPPAPRLTGQIGPGHAGAHPSFRQRVLARGRVAHPHDRPS